MATDLTRRLGRGAGLVGAFGGMLLAVFVAADRPRPASAQDKDDKGKGEYAGKGQKPPAGKLEWEEHQADSTVVRAHQHAAGAPQKGGMAMRH